MSKQVASRKRPVKAPKKKDSSLAVRDIMNKVMDAYNETDRKLSEISQECLSKECKLKVN